MLRQKGRVPATDTASVLADQAIRSDVLPPGMPPRASGPHRRDEEDGSSSQIPNVVDLVAKHITDFVTPNGDYHITTQFVAMGEEGGSQETDLRDFALKATGEVVASSGAQADDEGHAGPSLTANVQFACMAPREVVPEQLNLLAAAVYVPDALADALQAMHALHAGTRLPLSDPQVSQADRGSKRPPRRRSP